MKSCSLTSAVFSGIWRSLLFALFALPRLILFCMSYGDFSWARALWFSVWNDVSWRVCFVVVSWRLWLWRNEQVFNSAGPPFNPMAFLQSYCHEIMHSLASAHVSGMSQVRPPAVWRAAPVGWIKMNTDDVVRLHSGVAAAGGVLRGSSGEWLPGRFRCYLCTARENPPNVTHVPRTSTTTTSTTTANLPLPTGLPSKPKPHPKLLKHTQPKTIILRQMEQESYPLGDGEWTVTESVTEKGKGACNGTSSLVFYPSEEALKWLDSCAFGVLVKPMERPDIQNAFNLYGYNHLRVCNAGGESVLVSFPSKEARDSFLLHPPEWIFDSVQLLRALHPDDRARKRKCWIQLRGIPLQVWCSVFFESIGTRFGQTLKLAATTETRSNVEKAFIQVLTSVKHKISWQIILEINGTKSVVSCDEVPDSFISSFDDPLKASTVNDLI
ncbi:hypothetical protein Tsubulata_042342 [Turnera subulata]|uniref:DUF4283 domain-containing protein n=1 Tax=Turnera subulata TaxID=218843 RepID=A0A9Q0FV30_9ROSI|nr:hypothetical protein Tsubulata_042342 [Turnera subulata]